MKRVLLVGCCLGVMVWAGEARAQLPVTDPTGDDPGAVEMRARAEGTAGIQAMATGAMHSLEQRAADLKEFLASIGDSPDIQQTAAIQARLQLEQNYVAGQQAQATNLATLARAQEQVNQQRDNEMSRKDAEEWRLNAQAAAEQ